jgi:uncharacterized protein DUF3499
VRSPRRCSRNGCPRPAVATLTYVYSDSTAVVGPLAAFAEPHTYDLCEPHARSLTAPRGWELVRHDGDFAPPPPTTDDLVALADAVREAARPPAPKGPGFSAPSVGPGAGSSTAPPPRTDEQDLPGHQTGRRGHLRVIPPTH